MLSPYEQDIAIDESALDVEWVEHSARMLKYTIAAAEARREMDFNEMRLDAVKARVSKEIREDPEAYGLGLGHSRVTEEAIKNAIILDDEFDAASREFIQKKYEFEMALGVVKSFEHRKSALENLVRLHGQSYFAGPSVPHDLSASRLSAERSRQADRKVRFQRTP